MEDIMKEVYPRIHYYRYLSDIKKYGQDYFTKRGINRENPYVTPTEILKNKAINENHIKEDVARGIEEIVIPNIESSTDYSAVHKLKYIDLETYNSWPNKKMAKYYGAKRLYGSR